MKKLICLVLVSIMALGATAALAAEIDMKKYMPWKGDYNQMISDYIKEANPYGFMQEDKNWEAPIPDKQPKPVAIGWDTTGIHNNIAKLPAFEKYVVILTKALQDKYAVRGYVPVKYDAANLKYWLGVTCTVVTGAGEHAGKDWVTTDDFAKIMAAILEKTAKGESYSFWLQEVLNTSK